MRDIMLQSDTYFSLATISYLSLSIAALVRKSSALWMLILKNIHAVTQEMNVLGCYISPGINKLALEFELCISMRTFRDEEFASSDLPG